MNNRLRELRHQKRLSQAELAKNIGIAQNTLSYWEQGKYDIDTDSLQKLADYFECSVDYLLCRSETPWPQIDINKQKLVSGLFAGLDGLLGSRILERRKMLGMTQEDLASRLGYKSKSSINKIELGTNDIPQSKIVAFAEALLTSPAYLMGWVDSPDAQASPFPTNVRPITKKRFPMLGEIACGKPIYANEDHESYVDASADIDADFCLTAKGDSMIGARIMSGDVVFIKSMPIVDNGAIAAVIIDGEATLKRWYYYPDQQKLVLSAENSAYAPLVYVGDELNGITCLGKAVCFMSNL